MARLIQSDGAAGVIFRRRAAKIDQLGLGGAQIIGIARAHQRKIDLGQRRHVLLNGFSLAAHMRRKLLENTALFIALGKLQLMPAVIQLHHRQRLNENCGAGGRLIVHDGAQPAFEIGAQWNDIAPVALRDDLLLQHGGHFGIVNIPLETSQQPLVGHL